MKKKYFTLLFAFAVSVGMIDASVEIDGIAYNLDETGQTAEVTRFNYSGAVVIPSSVTYNAKTYNVTSIGYWAFYMCFDLTSVTMGNSVITIGKEAFCNSGVTNVTIPTSVTYIGDEAFQACHDLTSIEIPNSVTLIGSGAFQDCYNLTSVTIGKGVTSIGEAAFVGCSSVARIIVNKENRVYDSRNDCNAIIESASNNLLWGCKNTFIPNGVTSIGDCAFMFCSGLTNVNIPTSVTYIGDEAFAGCHGLTNITFPHNITSIGYQAFASCSGLTSVTIGNSVSSIGMGAFHDCSRLKSITCEAVTPPTCEYAVFGLVDESIPLYVPANSINIYKTADVWKEFSNILPIQAIDVNVTNIVVEPTDNSAVIQWPTVTGAYTYELVIKDKNGNIICTLIFNEQGQLLSIAFNAPKRNNAPQQTQTAGFAFTVTGLDSGTRYTATITSKASNGSVLNTKTVSFTTTGQPQAINNVCGETKIDSKKIVRNGQLLIQQGDKIYNAQGARVE